MAYIIGRYRVLSYPEWRRVFDEHKASYFDLGVTGLHVFRNDYEPSTVLLLLEGNDAAQLRAVWDSGVIRKVRHDGGSLEEAIFVEEP